VQLTLFHSDEVLNDDYSLMDVAYITAWNAVSILSITVRKLAVLKVCGYLINNLLHLLHFAFFLVPHTELLTVLQKISGLKALK